MWHEGDQRTREMTCRNLYYNRSSCEKKYRNSRDYVSAAPEDGTTPVAEIPQIRTALAKHTTESTNCSAEKWCQRPQYNPDKWFSRGQRFFFSWGSLYGKATLKPQTLSSLRTRAKGWASFWGNLKISRNWSCLRQLFCPFFCYMHKSLGHCLPLCLISVNSFHRVRVFSSFPESGFPEENLSLTFPNKVLFAALNQLV